MERAKEFITKEIEKLTGLISEGMDRESNVLLKNELTELMDVLDMSHRYQISKKTINSMLELPDSNTGYSDYRLMNDCESDDPAQWIEFKMNNENIRLSAGDIIIKKK